MTYKTIKQLSEGSNINIQLVRAVVKQVGGWDSFKEIAADVMKHGADAGFSGFIYYKDTCDFYAKNRENIYALASEMASSMGEEVVGMVKSFRCLNDSTEVEVGATLFGNKAKHDTHVANALAWFALEEVCRSYADN